MEATVYLTLGSIGVVLLAAALIRAVQASVSGVSDRRGKLLLQTCLFAGAGSFLLAVTGLVLTLRTPVLHAEGTIVSVQIVSSRRSTSTRLILLVSDRSKVSLFAAGRSVYFRPGEKILVDYRVGSGTILRANFLSDDAKGNVFNGTDTLVYYVWGALGVVVIFFGWKRYLRDPEGAEERRDERIPQTGVDESSLLHLSEAIRDD